MLYGRIFFCVNNFKPQKLFREHFPKFKYCFYILLEASQLGGEIREEQQGKMWNNPE